MASGGARPRAPAVLPAPGGPARTRTLPSRAPACAFGLATPVQELVLKIGSSGT